VYYYDCTCTNYTYVDNGADLPGSGDGGTWGGGVAGETLASFFLTIPSTLAIL